MTRGKDITPVRIRVMPGWIIAGLQPGQEFTVPRHRADEHVLSGQAEIVEGWTPPKRKRDPGADRVRVRVLPGWIINDIPSGSTLTLLRRDAEQQVELGAAEIVGLGRIMARRGAA